ncbi:MAG: endonuclease/exonuclease/phosphatase family protein [Planctomycetes bacterium]|nr:endonuclease/exonuclease/phosphatase family protein [Planctomycetota bacterium]
MERSESQAIKVATYNLRCPADDGDLQWEKRSPRQAKIIRDNKLDIIGIQEGVAFQLDKLISLLPGYKYVGEGRDDGKAAGEFSAIIYNQDKVEVLEHETFALCLTPEVFGSKSWGAAYPRICTWALLRDKKSGKQFFFANTHLDNASEQARIEGSKMVINRLSKLREGTPIIFSGDFNQNTKSDVYKIITGMLDDSGSISETPHKGAGYSFTAYGKRTPPPELAWRMQIDFIFVSHGVKVLSHETIDSRVDGHYSSDHCPVAAEIVLP